MITITEHARRDAHRALRARAGPRARDPPRRRPRTLHAGRPGARAASSSTPRTRWPHKNHARLFEAFALRPARAAGAAARAHRRRARRADAPRRRRSRAATCSLDELVGLYRGAAALVFPSLYEGFGMPCARGDGVRLPGRVLERRRRCPRSRRRRASTSTRATSRRSPPRSTTSSTTRRPWIARGARAGAAFTGTRAPGRTTTVYRELSSAADAPRCSSRFELGVDEQRARAPRSRDRRLPAEPLARLRRRRRRGRGARPRRASSDSSMCTYSASRARRARRRARRAPRRCAARRSRSRSRPARPAGASATSRARSRRRSPSRAARRGSPSQSSPLEPERDRRRRVRDLARDEVERPPRRLVVVEDPGRTRAGRSAAGSSG